MEVKTVWQYDTNKMFIGPKLLFRTYDKDGNPEPWVIPNDCVEVQPSDSLYKAQWNGTTWVETATQDYIDQMKASAPPAPPNIEDVHAQLQNTQNAILNIMNQMVTKGGA